MLLAYAFASILMSAFAAPAAAPLVGQAKDTRITVTLTADPDMGKEGLEPRQEQCNVAYCQPLYNSCVVSCASLSNGDWYVSRSYHQNLERHQQLMRCAASMRKPVLPVKVAM